MTILLLKVELLKSWDSSGSCRALWLKGLGYRLQALGCRLQASGYRLQALGLGLLILIGIEFLVRKMKDFKKLKIWQQGMEIVDKIYDVVPHLPAEERFGLKSQMTRSAISIPSNIAEGSAKRSQKEYLRYVEIPLGSAFELETHLLVVQRRDWVEKSLLNDVLSLITLEQRMLSKFIEKL